MRRASRVQVPSSRLAVRSSRLAVRSSLLAVLALAGCHGATASRSAAVTGTAATLAPAGGTTLPPGTVGLVYSQTFTVVSGGGAPYAASVANAPPGLSLVGSAPAGIAFLLSGTPTTAGNFTPQVHVVDATGFSTFLTYALAIQAGTGTIPISPASLPPANVGQSYNQTLTALAGVPNFTWSIGTGALPPGFVLGPGPNATTTIAGTGQFSGTYTFTVDVVDGSTPQLKGSTFYSLTVN